jgi:hypothetical protein
VAWTSGAGDHGGDVSLAMAARGSEEAAGERQSWSWRWPESGEWPRHGRCRERGGMAKVGVGGDDMWG